MVGAAEWDDDREDRVYGGGRLDSGSVSFGSGLSDGEGGVVEDGPGRGGKRGRRGATAGDVFDESSVVVVSLLRRARDLDCGCDPASSSAIRSRSSRM